MEVKRLQQVEKRYRADRDDLMRTIMGLDSGLVELDQENTETILGVDKVSPTIYTLWTRSGLNGSQSKKRKRPDEDTIHSPAPVTKKAKDSAAFGESPDYDDPFMIASS